MQAMTNALTVTQQLDNGVRFLDLRMMFEYSSYDKDTQTDGQDTSDASTDKGDKSQAEYWYVSSYIYVFFTNTLRVC